MTEILLKAVLSSSFYIYYPIFHGNDLHEDIILVDCQKSFI